MLGTTTAANTTSGPMNPMAVSWDGYWACCSIRNGIILPGILRIMATTIDPVTNHGHETPFQGKGIFANGTYWRIYRPEGDW